MSKNISDCIRITSGFLLYQTGNCIIRNEDLFLEILLPLNREVHAYNTAKHDVGVILVDQ